MSDFLRGALEICCAIDAVDTVNAVETVDTVDAVDADVRQHMSVDQPEYVRKAAGARQHLSKASWSTFGRRLVHDSTCRTTLMLISVPVAQYSCCTLSASRWAVCMPAVGCNLMSGLSSVGVTVRHSTPFDGRSARLTLATAPPCRTTEEIGAWHCTVMLCTSDSRFKLARHRELNCSLAQVISSLWALLS